jgi:hypothetical protein
VDRGSNRLPKQTGPAVPEDVLATMGNGSGPRTIANPKVRPAGMTGDDESRCPRCGHPGGHAVRAAEGGGSFDACDRCWSEQQKRGRPPLYG